MTSWNPLEAFAKPTYYRQTHPRPVRVRGGAYGCTLNKGEARMMAETRAVTCIVHDCEDDGE